MINSSFEVKTAEQSSGFLLWQVTTLWQREIKTALDEIELSHSGFVILASLLWFKEKDIEVTQTTIIEHTKLDKMTVSKNLKSLATNKFVIRTENLNDTRAKTIVLTKEGIDLAIRAVKTVEKIDKKFFSKLTKENQNMLNSFFLKLI
ncbi:MAG: MarR family winged helix-turn-helix transcriptional regulator [Candidatus Marinarcus sp.]|uniref:MarR family winged helix-turn-helix transcriptional regulator n=1 Tax=Candidatus Marinarcus sp. TaxID=3100987 RepID=UPI003B00C342